MDTDYRRSAFVGRHDVSLTPAEEKLDYPQARLALAGYTTAELVRELRDLRGACFGRLFGHNAQKSYDLVVDELLIRGVTELYNMFGNLPVEHWRR